MVANIGLTIAFTPNSSVAFQVPLSCHRWLQDATYASHLRCFSLAEGATASPVSSEPSMSRSDRRTSANPTASEVGAHVPVTVRRYVS